MRATHHRLVKVLMTASVLALAAGSTAAAATPGAHPSKKPTTPCTLNQTYKYTKNTKPRVWTVKNSDGANVRTGPGTDCTRLLTANKGTQLLGTGKNAVLIPRTSSKWIQVKGNPFGTGWIAATQLK